VVKETLPDVHQVMDEKKIVNVFFDRIQKVFDCRNPGWYQRCNWVTTADLDVTQ